MQTADLVGLSNEIITVATFNTITVERQHIKVAECL